MTTQLDIDAPPDGSAPPGTPTSDERRTDPLAGDDRVVLRWTIAALGAGAGAIHLAVVADHAAAWAGYGVAFAVAGWAQLAAAVALLVRPGRRVLVATVAVNAAVVAAWAFTRRWGWPVGPEAGVAEEPASLDLLATGFAAGTAVLAGVGLVVRTRPARATGAPGVSTAFLASIPVVAVLVTTTAVLASPAGQHSHGEGHGGDHEHAEVDPATPVSEADRVALGQQLAEARAVATRYPTVADAEAAGFYRAGPFAPGAGAHYVNPNGNWSGPDAFAVDNPMTLLYGGTEPTSPVVGVMYYTMSDQPPEGFAGSLDLWHQHTGICLKTAPDGGLDVPLPPDEDATEAQCDELQGDFMDISGWMVHAWVVPGWDSPVGVFAHDNPQLLCADGRAQVDELFRGCEGTAL